MDLDEVRRRQGEMNRGRPCPTEPVYEWDEVKRRSNIAQHGMDFTEMASFAWDTAAGILDDRCEEPG